MGWAAGASQEGQWAAGASQPGSDVGSSSSSHSSSSHSSSSHSSSSQSSSHSSSSQSSSHSSSSHSSSSQSSSHSSSSQSSSHSSSSQSSSHSSSSSSDSVKDYSRGDVAALPGDDTDLENAFTGGEYTQVETDDGDRVPQTATGEFSAFLFKDKHVGQETITVQWNGQSDRAPSVSTVLLQIYNRTGLTWETLATNNVAAADTDFNLNGTQSADLGDYFDVGFWVACRVYQEAV